MSNHPLVRATLAASAQVAVPAEAATTNSHGQRWATPAATVTTIAPNTRASVHGVARARSAGRG